MSDSSSLIRPHIRAMHGYVPGEQPVDPDLIKLNTNENPYPPSPRVADVLSSFDPARLRLYPDPMGRKLRQALADRHGAAADRVFVGNGSDEILALCTRAFAGEGGAIGWFEPSYSLYPVLADIANIRHVPVALDDDFQWRDPGRPDAGLFFITQPNAPTGMLHDTSKVESFCRGFDGVVLIDEAYGDFACESCMDLALTLDNVLVSRSFSKSYSLAGIRLGYVVGHPELIAAFDKIKDSYNISMLTQALGLAAVEDAAWMEANVARIRTTRRRFSEALVARGYHVYPSETNFVWIRPPEGLSAADLFRKLREQHILTRHFPGPRTGHCLRITIGTDEQMDRCLDAMA